VKAGLWQDLTKFAFFPNVNQGIPEFDVRKTLRIVKGMDKSRKAIERPLHGFLGKNLAGFHGLQIFF
jgi:hypothetical protein